MQIKKIHDWSKSEASYTCPISHLYFLTQNYLCLTVFLWELKWRFPEDCPARLTSQGLYCWAGIKHRVLILPATTTTTTKPRSPNQRIHRSYAATTSRRILPCDLPWLSLILNYCKFSSHYYHFFPWWTQFGRYLAAAALGVKEFQHSRRWDFVFLLPSEASSQGLPVHLPCRSWYWLSCFQMCIDSFLHSSTRYKWVPPHLC